MTKLQEKNDDFSSTIIVSGLALQNFRSHKNYFLKFEKQTTAIVGENAIGKTSIIEAINLISTGNSFRANKIEEMISFESGLSRVKGVIFDQKIENKNENDNENKNKIESEEENRDEKQDGSEQSKVPTDEIEIILTRGFVSGKKTQSRLFNINGVRRRKKDVAGKFFAVVFRPEDMRMIEGSPARRRNFIDNVLSILYLEYEVALKNYEQILKRRNRLLQQVNDRKQPKTVLHYFDLSLVKYGEILQNYRKNFLNSFANVIFPLNFAVEYDPSVISKERIDQYKEKEIIVGHTLIGPHKDDFFLYLNSWRKKKREKMRLGLFGSRGQQRLSVLWLKFCELDYLKNNSEIKTVLLLDDILSELDEESKSLALGVIKNYQSIITTTEKSVIEDIKKVTKNIDVIYL